MTLRHPLILCTVIVLLPGCEKKSVPGASADSLPPSSADVVITVDSLSTPESAIHDTVQDVYLVSNINGGPTDADNNGFISRIRPDGAVEALRFIAGGQNGVTLHGPKGLALRDDSLWVADLTVMRIFSARTGASLGMVDLAQHGAVFLNDVAIGPDGSVYITDSGFKVTNGEFSHPGPDRIYRIAADGQVTTLMTGARLGAPNGITWDASSSRLLMGPLSDSTVYTFAVGDSVLTAVIKGPGGYDGIEALGGGRSRRVQPGCEIDSDLPGRRAADGDRLTGGPGGHRAGSEAGTSADSVAGRQPTGDTAATSIAANSFK